MDTPISAADLEALAAPLLELEVSHAWKGCGSTVYVELGALTSPGRHPRGEANVHVDWDWRLEDGDRVSVGSSASAPEIEEGIRALIGARVRSIAIVGAVPELEVRFADGRVLRSMVMHDDPPQWGIRLPDGRHGFARDDGLYVGTGEESLSAEEREGVDAIDQVVERWGRPRIEPAGGECRDCVYFVRVDGSFAFLDYGCCGAEGPLGGRAVHRQSGCPAFERDE